MAKLPSEQAAIVATIDPDAYTTGTQTSDWVNMEYWHQLMYIVQCGVLASSATVDADLRQATSSTGAGSKAITSKSITQETTAGNDSQKIINLKADELDVAGGFSFVAGRITVTTAGADASGVLLGFNPRFLPANDNDLASVDEIVT